jgi:hypothetical protein
MDVDDAIAELAPLHARALRLRSLGLTREQLAAALGLAEEAVAGVLEVATLKLAHLASSDMDRRDEGQ